MAEECWDSDRSCRFCMRPDPWRIILSTDNFYVMLSLGPIVEGYTLVVARRHIPCCGSMPRSIVGEFGHLVGVVEESLTRVYGSCIAYEHGLTGSCMKEPHEPHCLHAHLHCVPVALDLPAYLGSFLPEKKLGNWGEFVALQHESGTEHPMRPYLLAKDGCAIHVFDAPDRLPRQYLRRLVAGSFGSPQLADWSTYPRYDIIRSGLSKVAPVVQRVFQELPSKE